MPETDKFVTFKWLIGTSLTVLGIVITLIGIVTALLWGSINASLQGKVSTEVYGAQYRNVCSDIEDIKATVEDNAQKMDDIGKNQLLVLRHLKIEPVPPTIRKRR